MPVFRARLADETLSEGTFEGFGIAGEDIGDAVEAVEVEGVEEVDIWFIEKAIAEGSIIEEVGPADASAVVPGLAEFERGSAGEEKTQHVFVFGEGSGGVDGGVVVDDVGIKTEVEGEANGFDAPRADGSLDHVFRSLIE